MCGPEEYPILPIMEHDLPKTQAKLHINILVFEAYSNMILACLLEPLRVVRDEGLADITWTILTPQDGPVRASSGLSIMPDCKIAQSRPCDLLIVVGGDKFRSDAHNPMTRRAFASIRHVPNVIAVDTGAWLLAAAGFLNGRQVTVHWQLLDEFAVTFPEVNVVQAPIAVDGKWLTCGSAAGAMELILREIGRRFGAAARFDAASMFMNAHDVPGEKDIFFGALPPHQNPRLRYALELMATSLNTPRNLSDIAADAGLSLRTMARLFETELGLPPGKCYQMIRLKRAREMMQQQAMTAADVAPLCGFSSAATLKRALSRSPFPSKF